METSTNKEITDLRQSPEYGAYMEQIGWKTVKVKKGVQSFQFFVRPIGPLSLAKIQRVSLPIPHEKILEVLKSYKAFSCKLEPLYPDKSYLSRIGFQQDNWPLLGTKTIWVDLQPAVSLIYSRFKKDARYCLRKLGNVPYTLNDYPLFYSLLKESAQRKRLWIPPEKDYYALIKSFGNNCFCLTVHNYAGCLVLIHRNTAYYYFAAATREGSKKNFPYAVVWEAMKEAKRRKCTRWDFEGIYDSRWPNPPWKGFTHFKKNFGGEEVSYPGSFTRWIWPF